MDNGSAASGGDPPESTGDETPAVLRAWAWIRPVLEAISVVAEAGRHGGPAWLLRGLVAVTDLAAWLGTRRR